MAEGGGQEAAVGEVAVPECGKPWTGPRMLNAADALRHARYFLGEGARVRYEPWMRTKPYLILMPWLSGHYAVASGTSWDAAMKELHAIFREKDAGKLPNKGRPYPPE